MNLQQAGYYYYGSSSLIACCNRIFRIKQAGCQNKKKAWDCSQASVNQQTGQLLQSLIYLVGGRLFEAGRRG